MTLDEAIIHAEEIAEINENIAYNTDSENWMDIAQCEKCAEEHRQLAEWLKELKRYQSVDAVEVVRCKDCRFWKNEHLCLVMSKYGSIDTKAEHYCSWGERREP